MTTLRVRSLWSGTLGSARRQADGRWLIVWDDGTRDTDVVDINDPDFERVPPESGGTRERVEAAILSAFDSDYEPDATEVAMALVDEDVSRGEYEGCSAELDLAAAEYMSAADTALGNGGGR